MDGLRAAERRTGKNRTNNETPQIHKNHRPSVTLSEYERAGFGRIRHASRCTQNFGTPNNLVLVIALTKVLHHGSGAADRVKERKSSTKGSKLP
jgi:hypothetical protein